MFTFIPFGNQSGVTSNQEIVLTPKALRSIRLALGLSIEQFAERIGLTPAEVSAMERGEMTLSGIGKALERLAPGASIGKRTDPPM